MKISADKSQSQSKDSDCNPLFEGSNTVNMNAIEDKSADIAQSKDDDWNSLFEEITATDIKVDHMKIIEEMKLSTIPKLEKKVDVIIVDYKICPTCDVRCKVSENSIICEQCGLEREWQTHNDGYSLSIDQNYNTSQKSYISFNIIGTGAYCYQRSFLKSCSDYSMFRNNSNKKEITNIIFQYDGSKPPMNVINQAASLFDKIVQAGHVYRKNGKKGVMSACLYYACIMEGIARTPKDIALIMNTEEKYLSQGDRILQELNEIGVIKIPTNYEPLDDYLNQFFPALGIPDNYKAFVTDLIIRAERKHLHIKNECRTSTKCVAVIYMLTRRVKSLRHIKKDNIVKECNNISKTTFLKYYNLYCENYTLLKKPFRKHRIPMPVEWKNN